jgi:DNA ligase-1
MIKQILDEIASFSGKNDKRDTLAKYKDNELLKKVIYAAHSPRINYHIKAIPEYTPTTNGNDMPLISALSALDVLSSREKTGNDAREVLKNVLTAVSEDDAYVIERIIDRNLKIGMDTGYNKVIPKLIEETPYQGAKSFSVKGAQKLFKSGNVVISQVKADGTYRNAVIQDGIVELESRQGEVSFLKGTKFLEELSHFPDCVLNGELTIDGVDRLRANGMVSSMMDIIEKAEERGEAKTAKKKEAFEKKHGSFDDALSKMRYTVWDLITLDEYAEAKSDNMYEKRLDALMIMIDEEDTTMIDVVETKYIYTYEEAMNHFLDTQERGLEGTIIKSSSAGWKDGKPTYQIKMKLEMSIDLRIVKPLFGNKGTKYENVINGFELISECGLLKTTARGIKESEMEEFTEMGDDLKDMIIETRSCGLSHNSKGEWSLMHPSVVELRRDKDTCDTLESAKEIQEMAKTLAS